MSNKYILNKVTSNCEKTKICLVVWTLKGMGGSEHVVYEIVRKINKAKYTPIVVSFDDGPVRSMYEELGVKVYTVSKMKKFDYHFLYKLRRILISENIKIVNAHHIGPFINTFFAISFTDIKLLVTEHSVWQLEELSKFKKYFIKILLLKTNGFIAVSKQIHKYLIDNKYLIKDKIFVLPNGIDLKKFKKMDKISIRKKLGFDVNLKIIGIVANIRQEKNHKMLISAFSRLSKEDERLRLVIVGLDFMNGEIQRYAEDKCVSSKIYFMGERDDVPELLNTFDVLCLPSYYEGLPLSLLEAMASEVPIIAANVIGINEIITNYKNGILFPVNNEEEFIKLFNIILCDNNLKKKITIQGLEYVKRNHDLDLMINNYEKLIKIICNC
jgi:glycosyltransferase involved in cell wall biosynthesis